MAISLSEPTRWLIRTDKPVRGAQSVVLAGDIVAWSDGKTVEEYSATCGFPVRVVDDAEMFALLETHVASLVTDAAEETEEQYFYALECLPPSQWRTARGVESFHICERITGDLVSWHAQAGGRFFAFNDRSSLTAEQVAAKVQAAL